MAIAGTLSWAARSRPTCFGISLETRLRTAILHKIPVASDFPFIWQQKRTGNRPKMAVLLAHIDLKVSWQKKWARAVPRGPQGHVLGSGRKSPRILGIK